MIFIGLDKFDFLFYISIDISIIQIGWLVFGYTYRNFGFWFDNACDALGVGKEE